MSVKRHWLNLEKPPEHKVLAVFPIGGAAICVSIVRYRSVQGGEGVRDR